MPQKTAYGLDGYTVRERHGGGVRMPGHMIGQPYLETALPATFLQYGVASAVARYRKYMTVLGQSLIPVSYTHLCHFMVTDAVPDRVLKSGHQPFHTPDLFLVPLDGEMLLQEEMCIRDRAKRAICFFIVVQWESI